jgi:hypothetical protein
MERCIGRRSTIFCFVFLESKAALQVSASNRTSIAFWEKLYLKLLVQTLSHSTWIVSSLHGLERSKGRSIKAPASQEKKTVDKSANDLWGQSFLLFCYAFSQNSKNVSLNSTLEIWTQFPDTMQSFLNGGKFFAVPEKTSQNPQFLNSWQQPFNLM